MTALKKPCRIHIQDTRGRFFCVAGQWPSWSTVLKAATIIAVTAAVVAAVAITVSTCGAGSIAGVAVISSALSIAAKTTEVAALQAKKSLNNGKNSGNGSSGRGSSGGSNTRGGGSSGGKSSGQVATDVIDAVFYNGVKILSPSITKSATTGASFVRDDLFHNPVFNTSFTGFMTKPASKTSMVTAYGFAAFAWIQTTISIFSDDTEQRAEKRGYRIR